MSDFALAAAPVQPGAGDDRVTLPALRDDLDLLQGPRAFDGSPTWTIHDPVRNRYFRIGHVAFQMLSRWPLGDGPRVVANVNAATTHTVDEADLERLLRFLDQNDLLAQTTPEATRKLLAKTAQRKQHWFAWLLKNYLFLRIPLVRPDRALDSLLPLARPFFSRGFVTVTVCAAVMGLVLAARQWEAFVNSFLHFLSWQGLVYYAAAIFFAKVLHELGHAFAAKLNGCRVPTMGVALLVLWPVLYTDTSDAWRLRSRRERLRIGAAGMGVELMLAAWATLAWSFLPDGALRSACFLLATVTWILTLVINLNPFLRFDGYYLLSDWLGVQNLQERGFALGRWRMREALFGLGLPKPERLGGPLERRLIVYAYATWVWRFFLFLAIALLVYHFFFKLLGLFLMAVELAWFIGRPVANELKVWWRLRDEMRPTRNLLVSGLVAAGLIAVLVVPWQGHVHAPATVRAAQTAEIFPPGPARLEAVLVRDGERVEADMPVYTLASPQLREEIRLAQLQLDALQHEILRRSASLGASAEVGVLEERLAETLADLRGLRAQAARLDVAAPIAGRLTDVPQHLAPGRWLPADQPLGRVVDTASAQVVAYVSAEALARLEIGAAATIYPDELERTPFAATVTDIEAVDVEAMTSPWLTSVYGGPIAVRPDRQERLVPVEPVYRVHLSPQDPTAAPERVLTAVARIEGEAESLVARAWRTAASVVIRESGF